MEGKQNLVSYALLPAGDPVSPCCAPPPSSSSEPTPHPAPLSSSPAPPEVTSADLLLPADSGRAPAVSAASLPLSPD